ncbi:P-loop containing nucleoside triphosphate hydrolase protein [Geranomyces variabilis]|nr:P-loop containing nucleoside triphosphate hydrolase protein [Geranomyces variabilis]KAJ3140725.1 ABC transporter AbcH.1 [Geranomyces variabilis]
MDLSTPADHRLPPSDTVVPPSSYHTNVQQQQQPPPQPSSPPPPPPLSMYPPHQSSHSIANMPVSPSAPPHIPYTRHTYSQSFSAASPPPKSGGAMGSSSSRDVSYQHHQRQSPSMSELYGNVPPLEAVIAAASASASAASLRDAPHHSHQAHRKKASRSTLESILPPKFRRSQSIASTGTLKKLVPTDPIVVLRNIHKTYLLGLEGVAALRGVSLSIQRGEWVAIYGTSGGGKTSLLNIVGTIDKPTKGDLTICDTVITPNTKDEVLAALRLTKLGFVFQSFNLISSMTALENVELPMVLKGELTASERKTRAVASLQRVGLGHRLHHFPSKLSGGEQQRVTIARAIANLPKVLLLDEPTLRPRFPLPPPPTLRFGRGDLDTQNTLRILHLLHSLNVEQHMTFIMVTHDVYLKNFAHRVVYMRDGKIHRVEMTRSQKRKEALEELEAKIAEHEGRTSVRATQATAHTDGGGAGAAPRTIGTVAGESAHAPGRFVSAATEVREPGDYATYSPSCGIPAIIPDPPTRMPHAASRDKLAAALPEQQIERGDAAQRGILRTAEAMDQMV